MMTPKEFMALVEKMRNLQKSYFKTRDKIVLVECKRVESQVDEAIKEIVG